jgi:hypothetical protein
MFNKIGITTIEEIEKEIETKNLDWFIVNDDYFKLTDKQRELLQNKIRKRFKQR